MESYFKVFVILWTASTGKQLQPLLGGEGGREEGGGGGGGGGKREGGGEEAGEGEEKGKGRKETLIPTHPFATGP